MDTNAQAYERDCLISALAAFIEQRPGFEFANYGSMEYYRADYRQALQAKHDAERLLTAVSFRSSAIPLDTLRDALKRAYGGRLSWDGKRLDYTAGQYFPMEYRQAVCAVLASALRTYWYSLESNIHSVKASARKEFGRGIAGRWF